MKGAIWAVVLMLGFVYGQTANENNGTRIVLPNPKLLRCQFSNCSEVWIEKSAGADAVFPKQLIMDTNQGCLYGLTALYDKSVPLDDIRAAINARYGSWAVPDLPAKVWRVEPEKFAIQLSVADKKDEKRGWAEAGTKRAIYIAFGGTSACNIP